ncbi:hypothetical protein Dimus_033108 [Dionaea muscipula]
MGASSPHSICHSLWPHDKVKAKNSSLSSQKMLVSVTPGVKTPKISGSSDNAQRRQMLIKEQILPGACLDPLASTRSTDKFLPKSSTLASNMLHYAYNGYFDKSREIWDELLNSSFVPSVRLVSCLIIAYVKKGLHEEVVTILNQVRSRKFRWLPKIYSLASRCFGSGGNLDLMERTLMDMVSMGFNVDSATGNAYIVYYSMYGSLSDIEAAYGRLKRLRILIEEEAIRAMSFAFLVEGRFYKLGVLLRGVGMGRRNVGNLLWNLLLLSYAANFKMKSLQREFLSMVEAGFRPDLTTFNIRALAFSRMNLFWDLHLSLQHMKHENVVPDLVTYGCVVDAYMAKRMAKNLDFALNQMINLDDPPLIATEPFVFEVLGKGDFHSSSEAFMEFSRHKNWTYRKLIRIYIKKRQRSNQVFWNY